MEWAKNLSVDADLQMGPGLTVVERCYQQWARWSSPHLWKHLPLIDTKRSVMLHEIEKLILKMLNLAFLLC